MRKFLIAALLIAAPASAQNVLPMIDGSGTITAGGTSQVVFEANVNRVFLRCQNPTAAASGVAAESLFLNYDANASTTAGNSEELVNGGSVNFSGDFVPKGRITVTAATTAHRYVCKSR